jgi:hypothetical protein
MLGIALGPRIFALRILGPVKRKAAADQPVPKVGTVDRTRRDGASVSATQPEPTNLPPPDVASLAVSQIERLVGDLAMAVERGDVRPDKVFKGRVQAVADRLLILIADDDRETLN